MPQEIKEALCDREVEGKAGCDGDETGMASGGSEHTNLLVRIKRLSFILKAIGSH